MAKNNQSNGKQVRSVKEQENPSSKEIQVVPGNIGILTVQLLNSINERLIEIRELLKNG